MMSLQRDVKASVLGTLSKESAIVESQRVNSQAERSRSSSVKRSVLQQALVAVAALLP